MPNILETISKIAKPLTILERLKAAEKRAEDAEGKLAAAQTKIAALEKGGFSPAAAGVNPSAVSVPSSMKPQVPGVSSAPGVVSRLAQSPSTPIADYVKHIAAIVPNGNDAVNPEVLTLQRLKVLKASLNSDDLRNYGLKSEHIDLAIARVSAGDAIDRDLGKLLKQASITLATRTESESPMRNGYFEIKPGVLDRWRLEALHASLSDETLRKHHLRRGDFDTALACLENGSQIDPYLRGCLINASIEAGITSEDMKRAQALIEAGVKIDPKLIHRMRMESLR